MRIVIDASAVVELLLRDMLGSIGPRDGVADVAAPSLLWSEVASSMRGLAAGGQISDEKAVHLVRIIERTPIRRTDPADLRSRAVAFATAFGWKRTYDAEYCVLAGDLGATLVTRDLKLIRGVRHRGTEAISLDELLSRVI